MAGISDKKHDVELTRLHVNIPNVTKKTLEELALSKGETMSTLVRLALREYIAKEAGDNNG